MVRKFLVAVDNTKNSLKAVKYVAKTVMPTVTVTVFSVLPDPTAAYGLDSPSLAPIFKQNIQTFRSIESAKRSALEEFMQEAKNILVKAGIPSKNVSTKILKKKGGIVKGILKEAGHGKYDTIVIGRRPQSTINQFVFASVSNKVVQLAKKIAVIVVD